MGAKGFILMLALCAVVGAGAGYGAAQIGPAEDGEQAPETADLVVPGAGSADAAAGTGTGTGRARQTSGETPTVDERIAALPEEIRQQMANDPELAAQIRARMQEAVDAGLAGGAFSTGLAGASSGANTEPGVRNAERLSGTVATFEEGVLRLETPDGEAAVAVPPETPVNVTKTAADAQPYLAGGVEVSVVARANEAGGLSAAAVVMGSAGQGVGGARGFGGLAEVTTGMVASFADGVLTLDTADGPAEFAVADETPVRITGTALELAGELTGGVSVTAFVQRDATGGISAASVSVGEGGGFGRGFGVGQGGGRQRGNAGESGG